MPDEKMKYPLLEFEYDKKLYEELLTLNPHPELVDKELTGKLYTQGFWNI